MKNEFDDRDLLRDVFDGSADLRAATLEAGLKAAQGKRRRRVVARAGVCIALALMFVGLMERTWRNTHRPISQPVTQVAAIAKAPPMVPGTSIQVLSDDELLNIFKDRPVALVGAPGHRRLVLLDEVRTQ